MKGMLPAAYLRKYRYSAAATRIYPQSRSNARANAGKNAKPSSVLRCESPNIPNAIPMRNALVPRFFQYAAHPITKITIQRRRLRMITGSGTNAISDTLRFLSLSHRVLKEIVLHFTHRDQGFKGGASRGSPHGRDEEVSIRTYPINFRTCGTAAAFLRC